ncbi:MAG: HNH endonuclease [Pseudohongiella sp.]|uniref:HNH endonuclease n=1 Tax=Pseudohongiella sp. TaxID=1979412 RepID=UPI0034A01B76
MNHQDGDLKILLSAFERVRWLDRVFGDDIPWSEITQGFDFEGQRILLANKARGIFKPKQMKQGAISIKTTEPRAGRTNIYDDHETEEGFFRYSLQAGNPQENGNKHLWQAMDQQTPFIYFHAVAPGRYKAIWPCYISNIYPDLMYCEVVVGEPLVDSANKSKVVVYPDLNAPVRAYAVREARVRLHQATFRANVLSAYRNRCSLSGLPVPELLEAAHITPDSHTHSSTEITNGIAMTRLHHRAYDANLIGITPGRKIVISDRLMEKNDGPVLTALKNLNGQELIPPYNKNQSPDRVRLAQRYEEFLLSN